MRVEKRLDRQRALALYMAKQVEADDELFLFIQPESLNVCFSMKGVCSQALCDGLNLDGIMKIGYGSFNHHNFVRAICVNPELAFEDIDHILDEIKCFGRGLV